MTAERLLAVLHEVKGRDSWVMAAARIYHAGTPLENLLELYEDRATSLRALRVLNGVTFEVPSLESLRVHSKRLQAADIVWRTQAGQFEDTNIASKLRQIGWTNLQEPVALKAAKELETLLEPFARESKATRIPHFRRMSSARRVVIEALETHGPQTSKELAPILGKDRATTRQLLCRMTRDGLISRIPPGVFSTLRGL